MSTAASKRIQRTIEGTRECLTGGASMVEDAFKSLDRDLGQRTLQGLNVATVSLGILAVYFGRRGQIRVIDGDSVGWDNVHTGIAYHFWSLKIKVQVFARTALIRPAKNVLNLTNLTSNAACLHCYHLATGNESTRRSLATCCCGWRAFRGS